MSRRSAGLMMFRRINGKLEIFLVHPGGPFWAKKDKGAWTIPKGEYGDDEEALHAAMREFGEETGFAVGGELLELGAVKQAGGKVVTAWAFEGDCEPGELVSGTFRMEWPPRSGREAEFAEVDRGRWFSVAEAEDFMVSAQSVLVARLVDLLKE